MTPPPTAPPAPLTDRERRDIRNRIILGIAIAAVCLSGLAGYVALVPERAESVLLALAIIAGGALIAWVYRCGDGYEHQQIAAQQRALADLTARLLEAVERNERSLQGVHQRLGGHDRQLAETVEEIAHLRDLTVHDVHTGGIGPSPYS